MIQRLAALMLGLSALSLNLAFAHSGGLARHGGVVATASDLSFELVAEGGNAVIYVEDHGKPMAPGGMKGKLSVLHGTQKAEAELVAGAAKLEAKGLALAKGAKAVAVLITPAAKTITVRFTVK